MEHYLNIILKYIAAPIAIVFSIVIAIASMCMLGQFLYDESTNYINSRATYSQRDAEVRCAALRAQTRYNSTHGED